MGSCKLQEVGRLSEMRTQVATAQVWKNPAQNYAFFPIDFLFLPKFLEGTHFERYV
jgi:hypothetical protein